MITLTYLFIGLFEAPLLGGLSTIASLICFRSAKKISNYIGKTSQMKFTNILVPNLILYSVLSLSAIFNPSKLLTVALIGSIGFYKALNHEIGSLEFEGFTFIGEDSFILILVAIYLLTWNNVFWMFYGSIFLILVVGIDLLFAIYKFFISYD